MDASIKSLTIIGAAAEDAVRSRRPIGSRKKRSTRQEDDEFLDRVKEMSNKSSVDSTQPHAPVIKIDSTPRVEYRVQTPRVELPRLESPRLESSNLELHQVEPSKVEILPKATQGNEQKTVLLKKQEATHTAISIPDPVYDGTPKVILKPAKSPRVKLQPKGFNQAMPTSHNIPQTRKARRIRLTVSSLNHRFTRAKRVKDDTDKKSMGSIRDYLVKKGVIQEKSKAPEKMLRSMYRDFMLLKDTAL